MIRQKLTLLIALFVCSAGLGSSLRPNVLLFLLDDSGWGDFHPFGDPPYPTPNVERLAEQGTRFNRFYVPQAICSASRSALMTGCFPGRTKMFGAHGPNERGLDPRFATMGEIFQRAGYATAIFGKWHLGDQPDTRPSSRGFSESEGLMYSNDMWEYHPTNPKYWGQYPLRYWSNGEVVVERVTPRFQKSLTQRSTRRSVDFINRHKDEPFFLYVPYAMPHVPLFTSEAFEGKSGAGLYGDVIMELDDSVGQILASLKANGVEDNTIVIFTSDNGPWSGYGNHAGTTPFREAKATGFNGGTQSALIVRYPNVIKSGISSDAMFQSVDLLPTLCRVTGVDLPKNTIDGRDVWDLITGVPDAMNPHVYYPFSTNKNFEGVMSGDGRWKLHLPHSYRHVLEPGQDGSDGVYEQRQCELSLFDLENDPGEASNVLKENPEVADRLQRLAAQHKSKYYQ